MEREVIKLNNQQWRNLVHEGYIEIDGIEVEFTEIDNIYEGSRRHTEQHCKIMQRNSDERFFSICYETSVKDEMGWEEGNYGNTEATEVFPEIIETIIYK